MSKTCTRCILGLDDDPNLTFDAHGVCNYCRQYDEIAGRYTDKAANQRWVSNKLAEIKARAGNKKYDSILGLSGGVDSSYLAYWAKENGLRPLIVHFDNGWNSELAVANIERICKTLDFELNTIVIDWEEFRNLQLAYFRAGVVDIECASDHAIIATLFNLAYQYKVHYILAGVNYQTECIMPRGWNYNKQDYLNLKAVYEKHGPGKKLKNYPTKPVLKQLFFRHVFKIEFVEFLNYIDYNKDQVKAFITEKLGWRDYGGKHYESQFTKIYQSYILPVKFGVDKRRAHFANLICSGQMTREEALMELENKPYDAEKIRVEIEYLLKKWGITRAEFDKIMESKPVSHQAYPSDQEVYRKINQVRYFIKSRPVEK